MKVEDIKRVIEESIEGSTAMILDPMNDGQHLQAYVVSPVFENMPLVRQHQLVMKPLKQAFDGNALHAMALKTFTPERWREVSDQYGI